MAQQGGYPPYNGSTPQNPPYPPYPPGGYTPNFPSQPGGYPPVPQQQAYPAAPPQGYPPASQQNYTPPSYPQGNFPPQPPGPQGPPPAPGYNYGPPQGGYVPPGYVPPGFGSPQPIMQQPGSHGMQPQQGPPGGWMNIPQGLTNCPPGLEYLSMIDQLLVHQKVEILEALTGFETNNKFTVKNSIGQKVYYAVEDNDCFTRNCCGSLRPFEMKILDNYRNQVINMHRPLACDSCCFPCCLQSMEISSPPGTIIGFVEQEWSLLNPTFLVKNGNGEVMLTIKGPICRFRFCGDIEFQILSKDGETVVGKISKQWSGLLREMFTDADYFGITFPMDLDVRMKAVLLGACFLIDAMFFEKTNNVESDRIGMI